VRDVWTWGALAAGVILLVFSGSKRPPGPDEEVLTVGDSLGVGIGAALRRRGHKTHVNAIVGSQAAWWAQGSRWEDALRGYKTAVGSLGSNDMASGKIPWTTIANLDNRARALGVRMLWVVPGTPLWNKYRVSMPGETVNLAGAAGAADGVHLTKTGYDQAAAVVAGKLGVA